MVLPSSRSSRMVADREDKILVRPFLVSWFPNSVWEPRSAKLCFECRRETEFRGSAFPNGVWERGFEGFSSTLGNLKAAIGKVQSLIGWVRDGRAGQGRPGMLPAPSCQAAR